MDLLRHLRFFVVIAEERHFGRAARRLGMAQPPLSQGLQRLEREFGAALFVRGPGGVRPTPAGLDLLPRARQLLDDAVSVRRTAARHAEEGRTLRLGVLPDLGHAAVARIAAALRSAEICGTAGPEMLVASSVELVDAVVASELDVAVVAHPALLEGLSAGPVVAVPTELVVPRSHRAASSSAIALRSLSDLRVAVAPRSAAPAAVDVFLDVLDARGCTSLPLVVPARHTPLAPIAAGHAFALTADPGMGGLATDAVVRRPLLGEPIPLGVRTVWRDAEDAHVAAVVGGALTGAPDAP